MEDLTHLINQVNRRGNNHIDYQVFNHSHNIEIQCYVGQYKDGMSINQSISVKYDYVFHNIESAYLEFMNGICVMNKLTESELFKIVRSYKEEQ